MIGSPLVGLIGVLALLIVLTAGVPIGVALGLVGMAGMTLLLGLEPALIKSSVILFDTLSRYVPPARRRPRGATDDSSGCPQ